MPQTGSVEVLVGRRCWRPPVQEPLPWPRCQSVTRTPRGADVPGRVAGPGPPPAGRRAGHRAPARLCGTGSELVGRQGQRRGGAVLRSQGADVMYGYPIGPDRRSSHRLCGSGPVRLVPNSTGCGPRSGRGLSGRGTSRSWTSDGAAAERVGRKYTSRALRVAERPIELSSSGPAVVAPQVHPVRDGGGPRAGARSSVGDLQGSSTIVFRGRGCH